MKLKFLLLMLLLLAVSGQPPHSQETAKPLSGSQVMELVKAGMDSGELADKVKQLGIDFDLTDDYILALRKAGAQETLIRALRTLRPKPLTHDQVLQLVAGHVPSQRAAALVKQHGIDFLPDAEYLQTLRVAGADDTLIAGLREASTRARADLLVITSPDAEVLLDKESRGHANSQGELATKAKLGVHTLKVSLAGKKDFVQSITLAGQQTTRVEARLEDIGPTTGHVRENPDRFLKRENSKDGLKPVWIPPGTFVMGCSPGDSECGAEENPAHQVTITKGFWIGKTPVTVGAYKRFAGSTGRQMPGAPNFNIGWVDENMPIVNVSWDDARAYCGWRGGRLPTEAEWEYAARGGSTEARYGNLDEIAWYNQNSGNQTHDVAQNRPNGFGLYDMLGNVWEWVSDWYNEKYYRSSPSQDPSGPARGQIRVLRGGSWFNNPRYVRVSIRYTSDPTLRNYVFGFRCSGEVRSP